MRDFKQYPDYLSLVSGAESVTEEDGGFTYRDSEGEVIPNPSIEAIKAEEGRASEYASTIQYKADRVYPTITEQLDQLYWDKKNNTNTWEEGIDAVKAEFPKGV